MKVKWDVRRTAARIRVRVMGGSGYTRDTQSCTLVSALLCCFSGL
jgi:hypothetical protein